MADCRKCKHNYKPSTCEPKCNRMCDGESDFEPITNAMRIRSMSDEELAEFFSKFDNICGMCSKNIGCFIVDTDRCKNNILEVASIRSRNGEIICAFYMKRKRSLLKE